MQRGKIIALALRSICLIYGVVTIAATLYSGFHGWALQLPASLDPSLRVGTGWTCLGIVTQGVVICAFLTALAESFSEEEEMYQMIEANSVAALTPKMSPNMKTSRLLKHTSSGILIDQSNQATA